MKSFTLTLITLISLFGWTPQGIAQQDPGIIYASVEKTSKYVSSDDKVTSAILNDISGLNEVAQKLSQDIVYPFGESGFRNQLKIMVEVEVDRTGDITSYRVHHSKHPELLRTIGASLTSLKKVTPIKINGKTVEKSLFIPITFNF